MSGLKGITCNTDPVADPHIYAEDDAAIYQSIFGGDGVLEIGQQCEATILSNNKVRISDGVICIGGHIARIPYGDYVEAEITNGQSGYNRNDIIVAKFVTTGTGGIDTVSTETIKGTPGDTAVDPEITQDDLYQAGKIREMPLYRVKLEGLSIVGIEAMFTLIPTIPKLEEMIESLNSNIEIGGSNNAYYIRFKKEKIQICYGKIGVNAALTANGIGFCGVSSSISNGTFAKPFAAIHSAQLTVNNSDWAWIISKTCSATDITQVVLAYFGAYTSRSFLVDYLVVGTYTE